MSLSPAWISDEAFKAELKALNCSATVRQLERWRNEGLLFPRPRQISNFRGSQVQQPATAARQALAIERALAAKKDFAYAGAVLWVAGFDVDDKYWRPQLRKSDRSTQRVISAVRHFLKRENAESTVGDRVAGLDRFTGLFAKVSRRLPAEQLARVVNVGAEILVGDFEGFDASASDRDEFTSETATKEAMDFAKGQDDHIWGKRLMLSGGLESVLAGMSASRSELEGEEFSDTEIQNARDDVRNALKIAVCLYQALSWIYGPQAFGLRLAAFLGRTVPAHSIFAITLGMARLRRLSNQFYSSAEVAEIASGAEGVWLMSEYFRDLQNESPKLQTIIGAKRLKAAFEDSREYRNLLEDLETCEFPKREFRPWDQWNKLSKKTISPGLLAMSIGAPEALAFDELLGNIRDHATP